VNKSEETREPEDLYTITRGGFMNWIAVVPCLDSFFEFSAWTRRGAIKQAEFFVNNVPIPRREL